MGISAYDALGKACGFSHPVPPKNCDVITSALFLNWNRARGMEVHENVTDDECWKLFFDIGFVSGRVLPFADAGIRPIVKRIIDLHWLTDECCSGHAGEFRTHPYIGIVFPNDDVRKEFVSMCKVFFPENKFGLDLMGDDLANDLHNVYRESFTDSGRVFAWFYERRMSTSFWWSTESDAQTQEVWHTFSQVLDRYDHKGLYYPSIDDLRLYDTAREGERMLERVYTKLCRG